MSENSNDSLGRKVLNTLGIPKQKTAFDEVENTNISWDYKTWFPNFESFMQDMVTNDTLHFLDDLLVGYEVSGDIALSAPYFYHDGSQSVWATRKLTVRRLILELWLRDKVQITFIAGGAYVGDWRTTFQELGIEVFDFFWIQLDIARSMEKVVRPFYQIYYETLEDIMQNFQLMNKPVIRKQNLQAAVPVGNRDDWIRDLTRQVKNMLNPDSRVLLMDKEDSFSIVTDPTLSQRTDSTMQMVYKGLSQATKIPLSKLIGNQPSGINNTNDADLETYNQLISSVRETLINPMLEKLSSVKINGRPFIRSFKTAIGQPTAKGLIEARDLMLMLQMGIIDRSQVSDYCSRFYGIKQLDTEPTPAQARRLFFTSKGDENED